ncbi:hypothetical protein AC579_7802 [Pseudocercospora musae]|uniref:Uncharacterized protein n=1 Tax=Pseudocercospora musae TaxID=113226 RepID=A0A139IJ34_9PEZI|nr:hypothetical protein AC579_7802 [Pseudocercospora musae]
MALAATRRRIFMASLVPQGYIDQMMMDGVISEHFPHGRCRRRGISHQKLFGMCSEAAHEQSKPQIGSCWIKVLPRLDYVIVNKTVDSSSLDSVWYTCRLYVLLYATATEPGEIGLALSRAIPTLIQTSYAITPGWDASILIAVHHNG